MFRSRVISETRVVLAVKGVFLRGVLLLLLSEDDMLSSLKYVRGNADDSNYYNRKIWRSIITPYIVWSQSNVIVVSPRILQYQPTQNRSNRIHKKKKVILSGTHSGTHRYWLPWRSKVSEYFSRLEIHLEQIPPNDVGEAYAWEAWRLKPKMDPLDYLTIVRPVVSYAPLLYGSRKLKKATTLQMQFEST